MSFGTAISTCFSKYVTFSGRATRSEFWFFILFLWLGALVLTFVDSFLFGTVVTDGASFSASTNTPYLSGLFMLVTFLPAISVAVRRLHDVGRSGWWYWIGFVPLVGIIVLIVFSVTDGTRGPNAYGPDPKGA